MRYIILVIALSATLPGSATAQCAKMKSTTLEEMPQNNLQEAFCAALKESDRLMQKSLAGSTTAYIRQVNVCMSHGKRIKQIFSKRFGASPVCQEVLEFVKEEHVE